MCRIPRKIVRHARPRMGASAAHLNGMRHRPRRSCQPPGRKVPIALPPLGRRAGRQLHRRQIRQQHIERAPPRPIIITVTVACAAQRRMVPAGHRAIVVRFPRKEGDLPRKVVPVLLSVARCQMLRHVPPTILILPAKDPGGFQARHGRALPSPLLTLTWQRLRTLDGAPCDIRGLLRKGARHVRGCGRVREYASTRVSEV